MKTINCTPTWLGLLPMMLQLHTQFDKAITKKNTPENRKNYDDVREQLKQMAIAADKWNAYCEEVKAETKTEMVLYLSIAASQSISDWEDDKTIDEELQNGLVYRTFGCEEAKAEYLNGLSDGDGGYENYTILTEEQYKQIENWEDADRYDKETPNYLQNDKTI